jgi:preprotein translocase subunit SecF
MFARTDKKDNDVELFRDANIDWLGKKWYFLGFSLIFSVAGLLSMLFWHGIPRGVDFKGGTQITVHFDSAPNWTRRVLRTSGYSGFRVRTERRRTM